jgi:hypothetical protein
MDSVHAPDYLRIKKFSYFVFAITDLAELRPKLIRERVRGTAQMFGVVMTVNAVRHQGPKSTAHGRQARTASQRLTCHLGYEYFLSILALGSIYGDRNSVHKSANWPRFRRLLRNLRPPII